MHSQSRRATTHDFATRLRLQKRAELLGIVYEGYQPRVRVLKAAEKRSLKRIG